MKFAVLILLLLLGCDQSQHADLDTVKVYFNPRGFTPLIGLSVEDVKNLGDTCMIVNEVDLLAIEQSINGIQGSGFGIVEDRLDFVCELRWKNGIVEVLSSSSFEIGYKGKVSRLDTNLIKVLYRGCGRRTNEEILKLLNRPKDKF